MLMLKRIYEPAAPGGRLAHSRRAPLARRPDKASAEIDRWEKQIASAIIALEQLLSEHGCLSNRERRGALQPYM